MLFLKFFCGLFMCRSPYLFTYFQGLANGCVLARRPCFSYYAARWSKINGYVQCSLSGNSKIPKVPSWLGILQTWAFQYFWCVLTAIPKIWMSSCPLFLPPVKIHSKVLELRGTRLIPSLRWILIFIPVWVVKSCMYLRNPGVGSLPIYASGCCCT